MASRMAANLGVAKEGVALYEADEGQLHVSKRETPEQTPAMAKEYFEEWFPASMMGAP